MGMSRGFALVVVLFFLTVPCITIIQPVKAQVENVATSASITIQPENVIEGQSVKVLIQIYPAPPSANDVFENLTVVLVSPAQGISGYGPWLEGPSSSDANGIASFTFNVSTFSGTWNVDFFFPGQYFANNTIYYQQGDWQKNFHVSSAQTPTPLPTATPSPSSSPTPSTTQHPTINTGPEPPQTEPIPITLAIASIASIAVIGIGLLVYFKKRKARLDELVKKR